MKPYYQNNGFTLYHGDALEVLKQLEVKSINCCVTSPPYFGLRDYGTGSWNGGTQDCDHVESEIRTGSGLEELSKKYRGGGKKQGNISKLRYKKICGKCGAKREDQQLGLEETPGEYVENLVSVFRESKRLLRDDGTLWLNLGDTYGTGTRADRLPGNKSLAETTAKAQGIKRVGGMAKQLFGISWRVAFALQDDEWFLRQDLIWHKPNPMPESVTDRCTKSHEYIFLLSKRSKYFFDNEAIKEECVTDPKERYFERARITGRGDQAAANARGNDRSKSGGFPISGTKRNKRSVWPIATKPYKGAHFATFPPEIPRTCIAAGCMPKGTVLDPFNGSGTTGIEAVNLGMKYIGIDINKDYLDMTIERVDHILNQISIFDQL